MENLKLKCIIVDDEPLALELLEEYVRRTPELELVARCTDGIIASALLEKEQIDLAHSYGLTVNCWTVDTKERAEELVSWGIDYITSNILE